MNHYRSYNLKIGNAKCEVFENCAKFMAFIAQKKLLFVVDYYKCLIIFTTKLMVQGIQLSLFFFTIDACHFHSLEKLESPSSAQCSQFFRWLCITLITAYTCTCLSFVSLLDLLFPFSLLLLSLDLLPPFLLVPEIQDL